MATKWTAADIPPQKGRIALVTGANRGLGLEIAVALAGAGADLVVTTRDSSKSAETVKEIARQVPGAKVDAFTLDQANLVSIGRFADQFGAKYDRLDILINNASAILVPRSKTADGFEMHFGVNHLGSFALTGRLIGKLMATPGARIVSTSSTAHRMVKGLDLDDLNFKTTPYKEMEAYGKSKLAALLFTAELNRRLRKAGADAKAVAAHPGYSNTTPKGGIIMRLATDVFAQPAKMGALPQLYAATAPDIEGGDYIGPGGIAEMRGYPVKVGCTDAAKNPETAAKLWQISEELTGIRYLD